MGAEVLDSLKRMFVRPPIERDLSTLSGWAHRRGLGFRRVRGEDGFVIDGLLGGKPWRMEWGPPQRSYIEGRELRFRMELGLPSSMQMLLLSRSLMELLERKTFEEYTDHVKTQINTSAPEEMRWLVMFPKIDLSARRLLQNRFGLVGSDPDAAFSWVEGALGNLLEKAAGNWLHEESALVVMTLRGRVYLRLLLDAPEREAVIGCLAIFEAAVAQAIQIAGEKADERAGESRDAASGWDPGSSTAWQSLRPDDAEATGSDFVASSLTGQVADLPKKR